MNSQLQFEINEMRQQSIQSLLGGIGVIMASLVIASLLPTLLVQFVYTDQAALMGGETPFWLQNGSMIVFGVGVLYFFYVLAMSSMNSRRIAMLKQQLTMVGGEAHFSSKELAAQEKELASLEKMVDKALDTPAKAAQSPRRGRGRPAKK